MCRLVVQPSEIKITIRQTVKMAVQLYVNKRHFQLYSELTHESVQIPLHKAIVRYIVQYAKNNCIAFLGEFEVSYGAEH